MKKHVPFLLSLLGIMGFLAWTASVRAQCIDLDELVNLPIVSGSAIDESLYFHTVTVSGPSYTTGQDQSSQGALSFSSINHYVSISNPEDFSIMNNSFTMAAWIYPTSFQQYNTVISKLNGSHRDIVFRFDDTGKPQVHFTNSSNGISFVTCDSSVISLNTWQHLAATWDGNEMRIYVNGQLKKDLVLTGGPDFQNAGNLRIGSFATGSAERLNGYIDDVQIRAYTTPEDEIACLMSAFVPMHENIVLQMPLDNNGLDISPNANSGTANGVTAATDRWGQTSKASRFNGISSKTVVPYITEYAALASAFTISAWIKVDNGAGVHTIISKTQTGRDIVLRVQANKLTAHYYIGSYVWCIAPTATITGTDWHHIACTWDGTEMAIYHNGNKLQSTTPATGPTFTTAPWTIGALGTSGEYFSGVMDDLKVWDRALSICELRSDMMRDNIDLVSEDNLVMCTGETQTVSAASGLCSYLWTNNNSNLPSFTIDATALGTGDHQIMVEAYDEFDNQYTDVVNVNVSLCTGIDETEKQQTMTIYPNPASTVITVNGTDLSQIELLDISGRLLKSTPVLGINATELNVSMMPAGVYFVRVIAKDGTVESKRLIKH